MIDVSEKQVRSIKGLKALFYAKDYAKDYAKAMDACRRQPALGSGRRVPRNRWVSMDVNNGCSKRKRAPDWGCEGRLKIPISA